MATNTLHSGPQLRRSRTATNIFEQRNPLQKKIKDLRCFAPGVCFLSWLFTCCWRKYLLLCCQEASEAKGKSTGWTRSSSPACLIAQTGEIFQWVMRGRLGGMRMVVPLILSLPRQNNFLSSARTRTIISISSSVKPLIRGER